MAATSLIFGVSVSSGVIRNLTVIPVRSIGLPFEFSNVAAIETRRSPTVNSHCFAMATMFAPPVLDYFIIVL